MEITFEVEINLGDPDDASPAPTASDIENAVVEGLRERGLTIAGATAKEL